MDERHVGDEEAIFKEERPGRRAWTVDVGIRDAQFRSILTVITTLENSHAQHTFQAGFTDFSDTHVHARAPAPCAVSTQQGPAKPPYNSTVMIHFSCSRTRHVDAVGLKRARVHEPAEELVHGHDEAAVVL